jgi:hypothetical protein
MSENKNTHVRFGDLKPGQQFHYLDRQDTYLKIKGITAISKKGFNCALLADGTLHCIDLDTAVLLPVEGGAK